MLLDNINKDITQVSSSALAYVGDAVYSLYVREYLALEHDSKAGGLHKLAAQIVSAVAQSKALDNIMDALSDAEREVCNRCKNAHVSNKPSTCTYEQYKKATGFEGVLGYLYLSGELARVREIAVLAMNASI